MTNKKFLLVTLVIVSIMSFLIWGFEMLIQSGPYYPISYPIPLSVPFAFGVFGLASYVLWRAKLLR